MNLSTDLFLILTVFSDLTMCVCALTCCVSLLTHLCVCVCVRVCTFPLSSLQSWQLLSPKLPCGLCFISSSLLDLLSTSLLCSQLLSTPTKVRPPRCFSPSATQTHFLHLLKVPALPVPTNQLFFFFFLSSTRPSYCQ